MADVETKETKVASPEKKVVEEVCEKKPVEKKVVEKEVEEVEADEDSRASENGAAEAPAEEKESKENGVTKVAVAEEKESESTENGDSTDAPPATEDVCSIKRKSTAGLDAPVDAVDGAAPEKKAKLETKPAVEAESNGEEKTAA